MATVTFAEGFTPDKLACLLHTMFENGVAATNQIGEGPDQIAFADENGDSVVLSGDFTADAEGEIHGLLTQIAISQEGTPVVTAAGFGDLDAHNFVEALARALDPSGDGPPELHDLFELMGGHHFETEGGGDDDQVDGDDGDDDLGGGDGDDHVEGGHGNDHVHGDGGDDTLNGDDGNDHVDGGQGDDDICGGQGNDALNGGHGDDTADYSKEDGDNGVIANLQKSVAKDTFGTHDHFKSVENLSGSVHDDHLGGDHKANHIQGNEGSDQLRGLAGDDSLDGGDGDDNVSGGNGRDILSGGAGDDHLSGGNGKDNLDGGVDDDVLLGGNGKDTLTGGDGLDTLIGGMGRDTFLFTDPANGPDTIQDFHSHIDKIAIDFVPEDVEELSSDDIFFSADLSGMRAGHAALIYDRAGGVLSYDADGAGGNDAVELAHLKAGTILAKGDFDFVG